MEKIYLIHRMESIVENTVPLFGKFLGVRNLRG
jgi:hypothetical protein